MPGTVLPAVLGLAASVRERNRETRDSRVAHWARDALQLVSVAAAASTDSVVVLSATLAVFLYENAHDYCCTYIRVPRISSAQAGAILYSVVIMLQVRVCVVLRLAIADAKLNFRN